MGRIRDAITVLRGGSPSRAPQSESLLTRLTPWGEPPKRGNRELLRAYGSAPWLRAVAGRIAAELASVAEWKLFIPAKKGGERKEIERHALLDLLNRANPAMTGATALKLTQLWIDLPGEAFWILERNAQGHPVEFWPVPPQWVLDIPGRTRNTFRVSHGDFQREIPASDVVWLREVDPENPYGRGSGIARSLADELDTDEYAAKRVKAFFYNGTSPEILVSAQGMNQEQARQAKERWESEHRGFWNSFRTFWTGSQITVNRLDTTFKDMQLIELRKWQRDIVTEVFGIPPEVLGIIENSNRATIDASYYLFARGVLRPRLEFLRTELQEWLVPQFDERLELGFVDPVPEDDEFKLKATQARPGAFTDNEVRELAGYEPADGKDEFPAPPAFGFGPFGLAGDPPWAKSLPWIGTKNPPEPPPPSPPPATSDVENILEQLRPERLLSEVDPVFQERVEAWARAALNELGAGARFELLNPKIGEYLRELSTTRISGLVNETTRDSLRSSLLEGVRLGEDWRELRNRVEHVFDVADEARAATIARTEVVRASNWGTYESQVISGVVEEREWVATRGDGRTRDTHLLILDRQVQPIGSPFVLPGLTALYPGDFGDPSEDINCRCTTVARIRDDDLPELDEDDKRGRFRVFARALPADSTEEERATLWKAYDAALVPWETAAAAALRRGFARQRDDLLAALSRLA